MRFLILVLLLSFNVFAIGISPGDFNIEAKKGEIIEKDFYLYNTQSLDKSFNIVVEGYNWFNFFPKNLDVKANSKEKVKIILEVPSNVSKGIYSGNILFKEESDSEKISLSPGVIIPYNITINDGFFEYSEEEKIMIYHSAAIFEQEIKEDAEKIKIKPEMVSFGVLCFVVIILLVFVLRKFLKISKKL